MIFGLLLEWIYSGPVLEAFSTPKAFKMASMQIIEKT